MPEITPSALYDAVVSKSPNDALEMVLQLKDQVKHQQINLHYAPRYFDSLLLAYRQKLVAISSFSTICHLIKRIKLQDSSALQMVIPKVAPFLFERLKDSKTSMRSASMKAIVTIWESAPDQFEEILRKHGLKNKDPLIRAGLLSMISEIAKNSPGFTLSAMLTEVVNLTHDRDPQVAKLATDLLIFYYNNAALHDTQARSALISQIIAQRLTQGHAIRLLSQLKNGQDLVSRFKTRSSRQFSGPKPKSRPASRHTSSSKHLKSNIEDPRIESILNKLAFDETDDVHAVNYSTESMLQDRLDPLVLAFEGKENEHNWIKREKAIILLRSSMRGNAVSEYSSVLLPFIASFKDAICKAVLSLRTTLSGHGCQLCKELGIFIGPQLDFVTIDTLLNTLTKLTSSRKSITHQRANLAVISLLLYGNYNSRQLTAIKTASEDKNVQPRVYAGTWLELMLLRYSSDLLQDNEDTVCSIIIRGISDQMPTVRESTRTAYWALNDISPDMCHQIKRRLTPGVLRVLERSHRPEREIRTLQRSAAIREQVSQPPEQVPQPPEVSPVRQEVAQVSPEPQQTAEPQPDPLDEIYEKLVGDDQDAQLDAVSFLTTYADSLPTKFDAALNDLSVKNFNALLGIFNTEGTLDRFASHITSDNLVRLCCFVPITNKFSQEQMDAVIRRIPHDEFCKSLARTMEWCVDLSQIEDIGLSLQFIKHKWELIDSCFDLTGALVRSKVPEQSITPVIDSLLTCWEFTDDNEQKYIDLLKACARNYSSAFDRSFNRSEDEVMKKELGAKLGRESDATQMNLNYLPNINDDDDMGANLDGLTMVVRKDIGNRQPSEIDTDMTLIMPKFHKREPSKPLDVVMEDENTENPFIEKPASKAEPEPIIAPAATVTSDTSDMAVSDINRLSIREQSSDSGMETIDPLGSLTGSSLSSSKFTIYEDDVDHKELDEMNSWYDFAAFRYKFMCHQTGAKVEGLLAKLEDGSITHNELTSILYSLQDGETDVVKLMDQITNYLSADRPKECISVCLFLMRLCMGKQRQFKKQQWFDTLVQLSTLLDSGDDGLGLAIQETLGTIHDTSLFVKALSQKLSNGQISVILESLYSLVDESIGYEEVFTLDMVLFRLLKSPEARIRKNAVMIYAKLWSYKQRQVESDGQLLIDDSMFRKLEESQLALVQHYGEKV